MKASNFTVSATILTIVLAFLVVYPLFMLIFGSFRGGPPYAAQNFTLDGYLDAYSNIETYRALFTTVWLGTIRMVMALSLAIFLAWVVTRTDTPGKRWLEVTVWVQFFLPFQPVVMAWVLIASPNTGFINQAFSKIFPGHGPIVNIFSYGGIIWVSVIQWAAVIFILITPAFRAMDAALEDSSRISGANGITTLRHITLPVLAPAILGAGILALVRIMESFETELFLGYSQGIRVFSTQIYNLIYVEPPRYPQGMALSTIFLLVIFALIALQWRLLRNRQYVTVTGRGYATRPTRLGRWKYLTLSLVLFYFIVGVIVPLLSLIAGSFMRLFGILVQDPWTVKHWTGVFADPLFLQSLKNSLYIGLIAATVGMVLYSFIGYIVIKSRFAGRKALDFLSWLPWGVPGMVMAIAFLWAYVGGIPLPVTLYGSIWLIMIVMIVRGLPLGVRVMNSTLVQLGNDLEESSRVLGASWFYTFRKVVAPLVTPAFISAWIILFVLSVRDLVTVLLLAGTQSRPLSMLMFEYWVAGGQAEKAIVLGLIQTAVILVFAVGARIIGARMELPA
ncbi:MAG: iron ABC transporter permease [Patescibacteria group bacterium]